MGPRHAVYAGSFDPLTNGHLDIIMRAANLVDQLTVGVGTNPGKTYLFPLEERIDWVREAVDDSVLVKPFEGLLVDFARSQGCQVIIRGLRSAPDFHYEFQMGMTNQQLDAGIETIFLLTRLSHLVVSGSMVKEIARFGGDPSPYVPGVVATRLRDMFA